MKATRSAVVAAVALTVTALVALAGCAAPGVSTPDPRLAGIWHLVSAADQKGVMDIDGTNITLTIGDFTGGSSPCNGYSATVAGSVGVVYIEAYQSAGGEDCPSPAASALDARYLAALRATKFASLAGGQLTLSSAKTTLRFSTTALPIPDIEQGTWLLVQLPARATRHRAPGPYDPPVSLTFNGYDGMTVNSACSGFTAHYTASGSRVSIGQGAILIGMKTGADCTAKGKVLDEKLQHLLFTSFTADITYAGGDRGTTLTLTNPQAGFAAVFVPEKNG